MFTDDSARQYDRMVDWDSRLARELPLLAKLFEGAGARRIVDFGCGPGRHAAGLARLGFDVAGVDESLEMRRMAAENNAASGSFVVVPAVGDLPAGPYDAFMSIGNTLPSIRDTRSLLTTFRAMRRRTRRRGSLLIQTRNYESLRADEVEVMGVRQVGEETYFRAWHAEEGRSGARWVHLHAFAVKMSQRPPAVTGTIARLRGWSRVELRRTLLAAGYSRVRFYRDYALTPFSAGSPDIVLVASC